MNYRVKITKCIPHFTDETTEGEKERKHVSAFKGSLPRGLQTYVKDGEFTDKALTITTSLCPKEPKS